MGECSPKKTSQEKDFISRPRRAGSGQFLMISIDEFRKAEWDYVNKTISEKLSVRSGKQKFKTTLKLNKKAKRINNLGVSPLKENGKIFSESKDNFPTCLFEYTM